MSVFYSSFFITDIAICAPRSVFCFACLHKIMICICCASLQKDQMGAHATKHDDENGICVVFLPGLGAPPSLYATLTKAIEAQMPRSTRVVTVNYWMQPTSDTVAAWAQLTVRDTIRMCPSPHMPILFVGHSAGGVVGIESAIILQRVRPVLGVVAIDTHAIHHVPPYHDGLMQQFLQNATGPSNRSDVLRAYRMTDDHQFYRGIKTLAHWTNHRKNMACKILQSKLVYFAVTDNRYRPIVQRESVSARETVRFWYDCGAKIKTFFGQDYHHFFEARPELAQPTATAIIESFSSS
jgi:pimeloyl-ACP methyl ester carboxylesterase